MINKRIQNEFYLQGLVVDLRARKSTGKILLKPFLVIFVFITLVSMSTYLVRAYSDPSEKPVDVSSNLAPEKIIVEQAKPVSGSSKMTASVNGWYEFTETSGTRLDIMTNMEIYVNGKKVSLNK